MLRQPFKSNHSSEKSRLRFLWALQLGHVRPGLRKRVQQRTVVAASTAEHLATITQENNQKSSVRVATNTDGNVLSPGLSGVPNAQLAARSLFTALNSRDVSAVLSLLAEDVTYENLGASTVLRGRAAVGRFYLEALAALPDDAVFVLEGPSGSSTDPWVRNKDSALSPILQAGVVWRVELKGLTMPLSRGLGVYWADPRTGRLSRIWDNPEHNVKQATPSLTSAAWASPLLRDLGPLVMPAALSVTSLLNNMVPVGSSEGSASGVVNSSSGGGSGSGVIGLADNVFLSLSGMMPFQLPSPAVNRVATAAKVGGEGGTGGVGTGEVAGISSGGGNRGGIFRDHTRASVGGSGRGLTVSSGGSGSVGGAGRSGVVLKAQNGGAGSGSMPTPRGNHTRLSSAGAGPLVSTPSRIDSLNPGTAAGLGVTSGVGGRTGVISATANVSTTATAAVFTTSKHNQNGQGIRMRSLPNPTATAATPVSALASVASSLASLDEGTSSGASPAEAQDSKADRGAVVPSTTNNTNTNAIVASPLMPMPNSVATAQASSNGTAGQGSSSSRTRSILFSSVDSGSDSDGAGSATPLLLPFARSTSERVNLTGLWERDSEASQMEEYELMLDVLELGGLQKVTARLIDGLDIKQDEQSFEVAFVTVVPFFRVSEKSRFDTITTMMRRDLRSGRQRVQATRIAGGVAVEMSWEAPLGGTLKEEYVASDDGSAMAVTSTIRIGPRTAAATQVYRVSSRTKSDFLASQRSSYGSLQDVLKAQDKRYGKIQY